MTVRMRFIVYAMSMHTTVNNARVYAVWPLCSGGTTMTSSLISLVELLLLRCRGWFLCRGTGWFLYGGSASLISFCEDTQSSVFRSCKVPVATRSFTSEMYASLYAAYRCCEELHKFFNCGGSQGRWNKWLRVISCGLGARLIDLPEV